MAPLTSKPTGVLPRRDFLHALVRSAAAAALPALTRGVDNLSQTFPFSEVLSSGISFVHASGRSPQKYLPESTGAGCAFFDFDNDGWMDIYLVNSGPCDFWNPPKPLRNALYRNNRDGTFTDVTEKAGVPGGGYGMGVAVGDYNGDGFPDLYVTQYGRSILYRNNGDSTFTDVTAKSGVAAPGWASSAVWFGNAPNIPALAGINEYCYPRIFDPMSSWLFHNNGDGTFTDVSQQMGIASNPGKAWGVVATDINNDSFLDLFVANDTTANFIFANRGGKRFEEIGFTAGVAYGPGGKARSGMGVDSVDFDQDGWMDLFVTNLDHEFYGLYKNKHDESFEDRASPLGVARASQMMSGWGVKFFDYDNDGNLDLFVVNGHPDDLIDMINPGVTYSEPMLLFQNTGTGLKNISAECGPLFARQLSARGLALGDFDNDGSVDVLVSVNDGAPLLLRNNAGKQNHWLGVKLVGKKCNPDAIGAQITYQAGDLKRHQMKVGGGSYLSSHDPRMVLGLGKRVKIDWLEVKWPMPGGPAQRFIGLPINRYITIVEGQENWK